MRVDKLSISILLLFLTQLCGFIPARIHYLFILLVLALNIGQLKSLSIGAKRIVIFLVIVILYSLLGFGYNSLYGNLFTSAGILASILINANIRNISKQNSIVLLLVFSVILIFTAYRTLVLADGDNMFLRTIGWHEEEIEASITEYYQKKGMMSYSTAHILCSIVPAILYVAFECRNILIRIACGICTCVFIYVLFEMTITTSLLLAVISTIFFPIMYYGGKNKYLILSIFGFLLVLIVSVFPLFINSNALSSNSELWLKLNDVNSYMHGGDGGQVVDRRNLYWVSIARFMKNPLVGLSTSAEAGNHSLICDMFAYYGLFAILLFSGWLRTIKDNMYYLSEKGERMYIYCCMPIALLAFLKTPIFLSTYFIVTLVLLPLLFNIEKESDNYD